MRTILWENTNDHSLEYFKLASSDNAFILEGTIVLLLEGLPSRIIYKVGCDKHWKTKDVVIQQERSGKTSRLTLKVSNKQIWKTKESAIPFAAGMLEVDELGIIVSYGNLWHRVTDR